MTDEKLIEKKSHVEKYIDSKDFRPMSIRQMAAFLNVPRKEREEFRDVLDMLMAEGKIMVDSRGKVRKIRGSRTVTGTFMSTRKDFGFVRVEGRDEDIFIPGDSTLNAFNGDTVQVIVKDTSAGGSNGRSDRREGPDGGKGEKGKENGHGKSSAGRTSKLDEGTVIRIIQRGRDIVVGTYTALTDHGEVEPDDIKFGTNIYIEKNKSMGAVTGHKVVVRITDYGGDSYLPEGEITEILGHRDDPGVDILSVIKAYELPGEFPEAVMKQAERIPDEVPEEAKKGRKDYRDLLTVTIDGEESKDFDDAVSLEKTDDGIYHLGVHIADVSHYVTEGSPLDKEALKRGTSIYLVDRVIPMIPHKLSNGICSLNEGVDRLALSCMMDINAKGDIISHSISESVIRSDRRMTYSSVHRIVELEDPDECARYADLVDFFKLMYELADILTAKRHKQGSIDFDFPESHITLDAEGNPTNVEIYEITKANKIIEEFMLAANQTVAEEYFWRQTPFVYRIHEEPDLEKIEELAAFVGQFGYTIRIKDDSVHPKELQKLLEKVKGKPEDGLISMLTLRSMKQARYAVSCEGHFGLAMKYYCHFTSPIRRYPDLQIHRIIKECLHGKLDQKRTSHYDQILPDVASRSSAMERRADEAERTVDDIKKAQYMEQFIGEEFDGTISGITNWGMFVALPNTVEGMIRVADIPGDYYYYDEQTHSMTGEHTGKIFRLGEKVRVQVAAASRLTSNVDFVFADSGEDKGEDKDKDINTDKEKGKIKR